MAEKLKLAKHLNCKSVLKIGSFKVEVATYKIYLIVISYLTFFLGNALWQSVLYFCQMSLSTQKQCGLILKDPIRAEATFFLSMH